MTLKDGVQGLPKVLTTESYYNDRFFKKGGVGVERGLDNIVIIFTCKFDVVN